MVVITNGFLLFATYFGKTIQTPKNNPFTIIPNGTIDILESNASSPSRWYTPAAAGMIVEGIVPSTPPTSPPNRSIAKVTRTATSPARTAGKIMASMSLLENAPFCLYHCKNDSLQINFNYHICFRLFHKFFIMLKLIW